MSQNEWQTFRNASADLDKVLDRYHALRLSDPEAHLRLVAGEPIRALPPHVVEQTIRRLAGEEVESAKARSRTKAIRTAVERQIARWSLDTVDERVTEIHRLRLVHESHRIKRLATDRGEKIEPATKQEIVDILVLRSILDTKDVDLAWKLETRRQERGENADPAHYRHGLELPPIAKTDDTVLGTGCVLELGFERDLPLELACAMLRAAPETVRRVYADVAKDFLNMSYFAPYADGHHVRFARSAGQGPGWHGKPDSHDRIAEKWFDEIGFPSEGWTVPEAARALGMTPQGMWKRVVRWIAVGRRLGVDTLGYGEFRIDVITAYAMVVEAHRNALAQHDPRRCEAPDCPNPVASGKVRRSADGLTCETCRKRKQRRKLKELSPAG